VKEFDSLADEEWRIQIDHYDLNEPFMCYPDPDDPRKFVGPLVTVHVGVTVKDEEGEEVLGMEGDDGRNLAAVACLPQFAELFRWIDRKYKELSIRENIETWPLKAAPGTIAGDYITFADALKKRVDWITSCIDDRDETMNAGQHGFAKFREVARQPQKDTP